MSVWGELCVSRGGTFHWVALPWGVDFSAYLVDGQQGVASASMGKNQGSHCCETTGAPNATSRLFQRQPSNENVSYKSACVGRSRKFADTTGIHTFDVWFPVENVVVRLRNCCRQFFVIVFFQINEISKGVKVE